MIHSTGELCPKLNSPLNNKLEFTSGQDQQLEACEMFVQAKMALLQDVKLPSELRDKIEDQLATYKGVYPPTIEFIEALMKIIENPSITIDPNVHQISYIHNCIGRYKQGIPLSSTRLKDKKQQIAQFKRAFEHAKREGVFNIDNAVDKQKILALLTPQEISQWPKKHDNSLSVDLKELEHVDIGVAQVLYKSLFYLRNRVLEHFSVDENGRHYTYANPFGTATGRDCPKGCCYNYLSKDLRHELIQPSKGQRIFILDYRCEEPAVLIALSGDRKLWGNYSSGDLYAELQRQNKCFSELSRKIFKTLTISYIYGISINGIITNFNITRPCALQWKYTLDRIFYKVNNYLSAKTRQARLQGYVDVYGWRRSVDKTLSPASLRNFFVQAFCAHLLQLVCLKLSDLNIIVVHALHDSITIEADINDLKALPLATKIMADLSEKMLGNSYRLHVEVEYQVKNTGE